MTNNRTHQPDQIKEDKLVVKWQLIIFLLAWILAGFVGPFLPHDVREINYKMVDMLFVCGTILLAVKLAREGWDMAAAGFTVLGIGWGIIFAAMDFSHIDIDTEIRTSAAYFFIPCMFLISSYRPFPWWLKLLTILCMVPYAIAFCIQKINPQNETQIVTSLTISLALFHFTSVIWGVFFYRQYHKKPKQFQQQEN